MKKNLTPDPSPGGRGEQTGSSTEKLKTNHAFLFIKLSDFSCLGAFEVRKINNKKVKIKNKEVAAPSIPRRGKFSFRK
jgi:hypothetical protein